jgi:hypothetical protein
VIVFAAIGRGIRRERHRVVQIHRHAFMVGKYGKRKMDLVLVPACFIEGVSAHCNDHRIQLLKLRIMFGELAEFDAAIRSPVSFVEVQQHVVPGEL